MCRWGLPFLLFSWGVGGESRPRFYEPFVSSTYTPVRSRTADPTCIQYVSKRIFFFSAWRSSIHHVCLKKKLNYRLSPWRETLIIIIFLWPRCRRKNNFFFFIQLNKNRYPLKSIKSKDSMRRMSSHVRRWKKSLSHADNDRCKWG